MKKICLIMCAACTVVALYSIRYSSNTGVAVKVTEPIETEAVEVESTIMVETEPTITEKVVETDPPATEEIVETELPAVEDTPIAESDIEMLAVVIYQEVGADYCCDNCRRRVADVVLNRVNDPRFPDTIEGVLTAPNQYGTLSKTGVVWPSKASNQSEKHAVERAYRIAEEVLSGQHSELYGNGYVWQAGFSQGTDNVSHCGIVFGK